MRAEWWKFCVLKEALEKIADPRLRDHQEPDAYTQLGCVMNIASEALEAIQVGDKDGRNGQGPSDSVASASPGRDSIHSGEPSGLGAVAPSKVEQKTQLICPPIAWVKNDPKFKSFVDGSVFLVALEVGNNKTGDRRWDFDVVKFNCDGDGAFLEYRDGGSYDAWSWEDFEYFALLEGDMPSEEDLTNVEY